MRPLPLPISTIFSPGFECACEGEVDDFAAVEYCGNHVLLTERLGCFLAEVGAGLGAELKYFHFLV